MRTHHDTTNRRRPRAGFSLIEALIAIAISGMLLASAVVRHPWQQQQLQWRWSTSSATLMMTTPLVGRK